MSNKTNISLKPIKVEKKDNTSLGKEASSLKSLVEIANELDRRGLAKEADVLDKLIKEAPTKAICSIEKSKSIKRPNNAVPKAVENTINAVVKALMEPIYFTP